MTAIHRFEIHLEHDIDEQYQYEPGELIRGEVRIKVNEQIALKAISIQIRGEATVCWDDEYSRDGQPYRADEVYVDESLDLINATGTDVIRVDPGWHTYPLEYLLPDDLPSSFIGKFGSITYVIKATLKEDKRFGLSSTITSEPFLVLRSLDIGSKQEDLLDSRTVRAEERYYGTFICVSGKLTLEVTLNKTGHLPGEDMFIDAEIVNGSPRTVKAVQAALIMHSTFHARTKSRRNVQIVNKKRDFYELPFGDGRKWNKVRLTIPPYIPESRLDCCDIIDIFYELEFKAELAKGKEVLLSIPITVGTVDSSLQKAAKKFLKHGEARPTTAGQENANGDLDTELVDVDMDEEEHARFRRPINPGETRKNPIFDTPSWEPSQADIPPPNYRQTDIMRPTSFEDHQFAGNGDTGPLDFGGVDDRPPSILEEIFENDNMSDITPNELTENSNL